MTFRRKLTSVSSPTQTSWPPPSLELSDEEAAALDPAGLIRHEMHNANYSIARYLVHASWTANMLLIETKPNCWSNKGYLRPHIGLPPTYEQEVMPHQSQSIEYLRMITDRLDAALGGRQISPQMLQEFIESVLRDLLDEHHYELVWDGKVLLIKQKGDDPSPTAA